jgi:class 3 adenylate cyclase
MTIEFESLSLTEIVRLQNQLSEVLNRRFLKHLALVFSDIVESTPYFERYGDEEGRKLQQLHFDVLNESVPAAGGRIVDTAGDGAFCCFPTVDAAIDALIAFRGLLSQANSARTRDHQLRIRQGIHWGEALTDGVVVTGDAVNLCSRVAGSAKPGEIRLTADANRKIASIERRLLMCEAIHRVQLKGIMQPVDLFSLEWRDRKTFPSRVTVEETKLALDLPDQDLISFGRLHDNDGIPANDIVLSLPDSRQTQLISRWHFELRREPDGYRLVPVSDQSTEVDGRTIARGQRALIRPGSVVRVARVMTLRFSAKAPAQDLDATVAR